MTEWLQKWYLERCNGDWEHEYGVSISTLDNPGWSLKIDLVNTHLELEEIPHTLWENDKNWIGYSIKNKTFNGACDPMMLTKLIGVFKEIFECGDLNQIKGRIDFYLGQ